MADSFRVLHPQWRDEWEPTPYPFGDWATLSNSEGIFLSDDTFLDASLYPIGGGPRLRLSKATVSSDSVIIYIGDEADDELASGAVSFPDSDENVVLYDKYDRAAGILISTSEKLLLFQGWSIGTHEFDYSQTGFTPTVVLPTSSDFFRGFLLEDGTVVSGDIWLVGEGGVVLSHEELTPPASCTQSQTSEDPPNETRIRVDIVGDPLFKQRLCGDESNTPKFLKKLIFRRGGASVSATPDEAGEIKISAGRASGESTVLRIRNDGGQLLIEAIGGLLEGN